MPKTVTATEAKNRLGALVEWVVSRQEEVIVESRGEPTAVIMSFAEYRQVLTLREQERRRTVLARLEALHERQMARNQDLTPEQGDALADRFAREFVDDMVAQGKIRFETVPDSDARSA